MASRRKQSKPKAFGINEDELNGTVASDVTSTTVIANSTESNNTQTIAPDKTNTLLSNLAPVPSTDLLSFNNNNTPTTTTTTTTTTKNENPIKTPTPPPPPPPPILNNKRKHSDNDLNENQSQTHDPDLTNDLLLLLNEEEEGDDDEEDDDLNLENEDDFIEELDPLMSTQLNSTTNNNNNNNNNLTNQYMNDSSSSNNAITNGNGSSLDQSLMFKCKVCGKGFKHRRSLNRHVRLHSGEKNYKCPHCTTAFARSDHLKAHIRTHNNSKPYRCSVCQCGYNTQAALKVHIAHHHSKSKFKCALCNNLEFHSQLALEGHVYTKHTKGGTELDLDPTGAYSVNKINHLNETEIDSFYNSKLELNGSFNTSTNGQQQQQQHRVKLADINNYSNNNDLNESMESNFNYNLNNDNIENRENLLKLNDESMTMTANDENNMKIINSTDTATIIDNYGEDDDIENNSDLSATSLSKLNNTNNTDTMDDIIIDESQSTKNNNNFKPSLGVGLAAKLPIPLNRNLQQQHKPLPNPPPLLLPANHRFNHLNSYNSATNNNNKSNVIIANNNPKLNNTYCELCNARFSNPESFQAHMRNCHPELHLQQQQPQPQRLINDQQEPIKMPYLTSILNKSNSTLTNGKPMNEQTMNKPTSGGFIITNNAIILTSSNPLAQTTSTCTRPNCNCSSSCLNRCLISKQQQQQISPTNKQLVEQDNNDNLDQQINNYYAIKETHFTCSQCNLTLYKQNDYIAHLKQEHCVEVFRCVLCKQMQLFDNLNLLKEHFFQEHLAQKYEYYRCRLCISTANLLFNSLDELNLHLKTIHHVNNNNNTNKNLIVNNNNEMRILSNGGHVVNMLPPPVPALPVSVPTQQTTNLPMHLVTAAGATATPIYSNSHQFQASFNNDNRSYYSNNNNNNTKCFKCNYCESDFAQQSYLNQHIQMVHANKVVAQPPAPPPLPPPPPPAPAPAPVVPSTNLFSQTTSQIYSCQHCRATFANRSQLERHVRIHDLKCNICDKIFENEDLLSQHKLIHSNKTTIINQPNQNNDKPPMDSSFSAAVCVYCKQTIENESMFKEHFKRHNNIGQPQQQQGSKVNSFICIVCRQTLTSNNEYNLHMRHHLRRNLNQNKSTATTNPKTIEPIQTQATTNNLEATPTPSTTTTTTTTSTTSNISAKKDDSSKLRCSKCLVKFEVWQELADHIAEAHPALKSAIINESIVNNNNSKEQNKTPIKEEKKSPPPPQPQPQPVIPQHEIIAKPTISNENKCEICTSKFDSNTKLQCHLLIKHEFANTNVFTCPVCDEGFSRPENLIQHTFTHGQAAQLYKCTECNFKFVFKSQLINHSFSHQKMNSNSDLVANNKRPIGVVNNNNNNNINQNNNIYKNNNNNINNTNNLQIIRPRPPIPHPHPPHSMPSQAQSLNNNYQLQYQQQQQQQHQSMYNQHQHHHHQHQSNQRLFCHECSLEFGSFRHYQLHLQTVHNRIIIQNNNNNNTIF